MRFLLTLTIDPRDEAGRAPDSAWLAAMIRYNRELRESGVLLGADGLGSTRLRFSGGRVVGIERLFASMSGPITAFWLIQVENGAEAVRWAGRAPVRNGALEVREVLALDGWEDSAAPHALEDDRSRDSRELPELTAGRPSGGW